jgi:hypothetical protein
VLIPCSRTREGMESDYLLCSRNAHDRNVLVRRAQWKISQPPSLKRERASVEGSSVISLHGRSGINTGAIPKRARHARLERLLIRQCLLDARIRGSTRLPLEAKSGL